MKIKEGKIENWEPPFCYNPFNIPTLKWLHTIMNDRLSPIIPRGGNSAMKYLREYYMILFCAMQLYQKIAFSQEHYPLDVVNRSMRWQSLKKQIGLIY